jgi:hypothetical protein
MSETMVGVCALATLVKTLTTIQAAARKFVKRFGDIKKFSIMNSQTLWFGNKR